MISPFLCNCETRFAIENSRLSQRAAARFGRREASHSSAQGVFAVAELRQKRFETPSGSRTMLAQMIRNRLMISLHRRRKKKTRAVPDSARQNCLFSLSFRLTAGFGTLSLLRLPGFTGPFPPPLLIRCSIVEPIIAGFCHLSRTVSEFSGSGLVILKNNETKDPTRDGGVPFFCLSKRKVPKKTTPGRGIAALRCRWQEKQGRNFRSRALGGPSRSRPGNGKCGKVERFRFLSTLRCPKNAAGLRFSLHFSTAAEKAPALHPPLAAGWCLSPSLDPPSFKRPNGACEPLLEFPGVSR